MSLYKSLKEKYENHNVKDLKKALKTLKTSKSNLAEIKYVSRLLREKLDANTVNKATDTADESLNHDNYVEYFNNFIWITRTQAARVRTGP